MLKKIFLGLFVAGAMMTSCNKEEGKEEENTPLEISTEVVVDDVFEDTLYPALIYTLASTKNDEGKYVNEDFFGLKVKTNKPFKGKIKISNEIFASETIISKSFEKGDNEFGVSPVWKYSDFINVKKAGYTNFKFEIIDDQTGKVVDTKNLQLSYHPINQCVFYVNVEGQGVDLFPFFSAYVNEDSSEVIAYLGEVSKKLAGNPSFRGWIGEQGGDNGIMNQLLYLFYALSMDGFTYSSIADSSAFSNAVGSQYVRLVDETLKTKQANCVDGSVLLASILKKIEMKPYLVLHKGHMYLGVKLPESDRILYIETTEISRLRFAQNDAELINIFSQLISYTTFKSVDETTLIDVTKAREVKIKPIQ